MTKKVVIFGSRRFSSHTEGEIARLIITALDSLSARYKINSVKDIEIISGMARGVDKIGFEIARIAGIKCLEYPANWKGLGRKAGYMRNEEMANVADIGLCFWNGESMGTKHMIDSMRRRDKPVEVYILK